MSFIYTVRRALWKFGYDVIRFSPQSHLVARRKRLLNFYPIDIALDVGANSGQFARELRQNIGFIGKIVSFEPLSSAYAILEQSTKEDELWESFNFALGDAEATKIINVSDNSVSSSLLDMLPAHVKCAPNSKYIATEVVEVKTLDSIFSEICSPTDEVFLKIDAQGYEDSILNGAGRSLPQINTLQLEMSLVPLYEKGILFQELLNRVISYGYSLVGIEPGFINGLSGELLQMDCIFHRQSSVAPKIPNMPMDGKNTP